MPNSCIENYNFPVKRYRDSTGCPTCAIKTGEVCIFYRTQRFGCNETCVFADDTGHEAYFENMKRRDNGNGSLIPLKTCPIWQDT